MKWLMLLIATVIVLAASWTALHQDERQEATTESPYGRPATLTHPDRFRTAYLDANFPPALISHAQSIRASGWIESETNRQAFTLIKKRPDSMRLTIDHGGQEMTIGVHDGTVWQRIRRPQHEDWIQALEGPEAEVWSTQSHFYDVIIRSFNGKGSIDAIETAEQDGRTWLKVQLGGELDPVEIWIDPQTMYPAIQREPLPDGGTQELRYSDYRKIKGMALPFTTETWIEGTFRSRTILESAELNIGILTASFEMPTQ